MYSATSKATEKFCEKTGINFQIQFVETMQRNGKLYVRGTAGKPDEFALLKSKVRELGAIYTGTI
jgi:hypothetical protein